MPNENTAFLFSFQLICLLANSSQAAAQFYNHVRLRGITTWYMKRSMKKKCRHKAHPDFKLCTVDSVAFIIYCLSTITFSDHQQHKELHSRRIESTAVNRQYH
uniref:Secreted protein n=1 Tax=Rhipicephalus appendiculatus TaxID=34631 RepID=A0A131YGA1_RHIAP